MKRISITVELPWGMVRVIKSEAKRWGCSLDQTVEDMLRRFLNKDAKDEEAMRIIRDAAALIEKRKDKVVLSPPDPSGE